MSKKETDISQIRKYLDGELDAKAMHQLERRAQDDPFLMDALEGYEQSGRDQQIQLNELTHRLQQRISPKERRIIPWKFMAVAASVLVVLTAGGLWFYHQQPAGRAKTAILYKPENKPTTIEPSASASAKKSSIAVLTEAPRPKVPQKTTVMSEERVAAARVRAPGKPIAGANDIKPGTFKDTTPVNELIVMDYKSKKSNNVMAAPAQKPDANTAVGSQRKLAEVLVGKAAKFKSGLKTISGTVVSKNDNLPIVGAIVKVAGTNTGTFTDANGHFILPADSGNIKLNIAYIGYEAKQVNINDKNPLKVALQPESNTLSEIVATGFLNQHKKDAVAKARRTDTGLSKPLVSKVPGLVVTSGSRTNDNYTIVGNNLVKGVVIGKDDRLPIPGASVKVAGTNIVAVTDLNGRFALPADSNKKLVIANLGYETLQVNANNRDSLKTIALQPSSSSLNEVVVTEYSRNTGDAMIIDARPQEGWNSFRKYLKEKARSPDGKTGIVRLSFMVAPNGTITGITILKGLSKATDQKAIDLINGGPGWIGSTSGKPEKVRVRIKFPR